MKVSFQILLLSLFYTAGLFAQKVEWKKVELTYSVGGSIDWPELTSVPNDAIRKTLEKNIAEAILGPADQRIFSDLNALKKTKGQKENPKVKGLLEDCPACEFQEGVTLSQKERVISMNYGYSEFCCGAHGMYGGYTKNFDVKDGRELKLSDIFQGGWESAFKKLGEKKLRKELNVPQGQSLADYGFDGFYEGFFLPENVSFEEKYIRFSYDPYEAGPWVMGAPEFVITYEEAKPYIRPDGPLGSLSGGAVPADLVSYKGNIRGDLNITLLINKSEKISGYYYYDSKGPNSKIQLTGQRKGTNVTLTESVNGQVTGTFDLTLSPDGSSAAGSWIGSKGQKLSVTLKRQ